MVPSLYAKIDISAVKVSLSSSIVSNRSTWHMKIFISQVFSAFKARSMNDTTKYPFKTSC